MDLFDFLSLGTIGQVVHFQLNLRRAMDEIPHAIVFDLDGTLVNNARHLYRATIQIFRLCHLPEPSFREYCTEFGAPYMAFYRKRGVRVSDDQIWEWYHRQLGTVTPNLFDDVSFVLELLHRARFTLGVVSGQRKAVLETLFRRCKIDRFFAYIQGDQEDKVSALRRFCRRNGFKPATVWYVGDFVSDMTHASQAGVCPIGITRGRYTVRVLKRAGAMTCITDLSDLLPLLKLPVQYKYQ